MAKTLTPFQLARFKLTGWYLLMFTILIGTFTYLTIQAKQSAYVRVYQVVNSASPGSPQVVEFADKFEEFNRRFRERLIFFDVVLFGISGWLAYFLSGKTLKPIQNMVEEQTAFAADVSHSLRTPLTTISLEVETYTRLRQRIPKDLKLLFTSIQEEVFSMTQLVSGMLTLVRSETDTFRSRFSLFDLKDIVQGVVTKMQPLAGAKNQQLKMERVDKVKLQGNADSLKQVLYILLDNAIKYSGSGSITTVSLMKQASVVKLIVRDTGKGIPKRDLPHIFNRYYRADKKTKGTGLGLAIAAKLVAQHEGTIKVTSEVHKGTNFTVTLPLNVPDQS